MKLRIGTRRSALAQKQARIVIDLIHKNYPEIQCQLKFIESTGDKDRKSEFYQFGIIGVFSNEHEELLLSGDVDVVVHSLKDLPTTLRKGLVLAAVPQREDPRDVLCGATLASLAPEAKVGTGSLRRRAQMMTLRPDIQIIPIRGNLQPRLKKAKSGGGNLDAVLLGAAGLNRLSLENEISETLDPAFFPYAVGQGALGVQARASDTEIIQVLKTIEHAPSRAEVDAERAMMHHLGAGCSLPLGVNITWKEGRIILQATVTSIDGSQRIVAIHDGEMSEAEALGIEAGKLLKEQGADRLIEVSFKEFQKHLKWVVPTAH
jgi:hydroxymethylbilane synthase